MVVHLKKGAKGTSTSDATLNTECKAVNVGILKESNLSKLNVKQEIPTTNDMENFYQMFTIYM